MLGEDKFWQLFMDFRRYLSCTVLRTALPRSASQLRAMERVALHFATQFLIRDSRTKRRCRPVWRFDSIARHRSKPDVGSAGRQGAQSAEHCGDFESYR